MWLRGSIYERIPQIMLVLGLLFMFSAAYLDLTDPWAKLYFGTGTICFLWSLWVVSARLRHRKPEDEDAESVPASTSDKDDSPSETGA